MHLFSPNHVQLINACYPPSSALLTSAPSYRPNSQELSRLTYYASNRPGKVAKLGEELLKRAQHHCRKAKAGNTRSRGALLITLNILKALATECRRDISLLSPSLVSTVAFTLSALPSDLEVSARAASLFTAWTTFTNGQLIGLDSAVTRSYLSALHAFSRLTSIESKSDDHEMRNRTRLVGTAALRGAVNSEALYHDLNQFRAQVSEIIHPLLVTLLQTNLSVLDAQASEVKQDPTSPYLAEFRRRPAIERRAASIHIHVDGDSGPSTSDVSNACLQVLFSLLEHSNGAQIGHFMRAVFDALDGLEGWHRLDHCCWFAQKASEWSQYQHRYAVPTCLVERLVESQDAPVVAPFQTALTAMITTVFNSPTPLINLSTSDIVSNLITVVLRRAAIDSNDPLLPPLVGCIASLGSHVYYSDQVQDLAGELISRLVVVELYGIVPGKVTSEVGRSQAIRCLIAGILGLMQAASKDETLVGRVRNNEHASTSLQTTSFAPSAASAASSNARLCRRTRISADAWQDTLTLLCDREYSVRADCCDALVSYLRSEIRQKGDTTAADGVKRVRPLAEGPIQQAKNVTFVLFGDSATRLLNAVHAYLYILATSTSMAPDSNLSPPVLLTSELPPAVRVEPATPSESADAIPDPVDRSPQSSEPNNRRHSITVPSRSHKQSIVRRLLSSAPSRISSAASACVSDYSHILVILTVAHERLPIRGLLTGVPMLMALDQATRVDAAATDFSTWQRAKTVREVVARVWAVIAKVWDLPELADMAATALSSLPGGSSLPLLQPFEGQMLHSPREAIPFPPKGPSPRNEAWSGVNADAALSILASSQSVQDATALDSPGLLRRFSAKWSPNSALRDSVEKPSTFGGGRGDGVSPLLKISPALMQGENISLQSLARSTRGVGVTDLREALEGRSGKSSPALAKPASISTLERGSWMTGSDTVSTGLALTPSRSSRKRAVTSGSGEVRDVLNKLGIGKQNGSSLLKSSFPSLQKSNGRAPPYSA